MNWISPVILQVLRKVNDGSSTKMLRRTITEYKKKMKKYIEFPGTRFRILYGGVEVK